VDKGKTVSHVSAVQQTTGEMKYVDDLDLPPKTLHVALVQSSVPHGIIRRIDFSNCKGVAATFTAKDLPRGENLNALDEEILASEKVVFQGQPIAVVAAETEAEAWEAARAVKVEYSELPSTLSIDEAILCGKIHEGAKLSQGNFDAAIKNARHRLKGSVKMGGQLHFYLETNAVLVNLGENGKVHVNATVKDLEGLQAEVSRVLGVPRNRVECQITRIGGAFCGKSDRSLPLGALAAFIAQKLQRPIKLRLPRSVDTQLQSGDHQIVSNFEVGFDDDGRITALKIDNYVDGGFSFMGSRGLCRKSLLHGESVYNIDNLVLNYYLCQTNKISGAAFRGFGCQHGHIGIEAAVDRVSRFLGKPVHDVNFYKANDRTPYGVVLDDFRFPECWSRLDGSRRSIDAFNRANKYKKRGFAMTPLKFGIGFPSVLGRRGNAMMHLYRDGTVRLAHSGIEFGQGIHTKMSQIAAEVLDIPVETVRIDGTDLALTANGAETGGSAGTNLQGFAVKQAAEEMRDRLAKYRTPGRTFAEAAEAAFQDRMDMTTRGFYKDPGEGFSFDTMKGVPYMYYEFGAAASQVEIDVLTGSHRVLRTEIVFDAGRSINPGIDIGQIEGGFLQGYGWMTKEDVVIADNSCRWRKAGTYLSDSFRNYKIPGLTDVPAEFSVTLLPSPTGKTGGVLSAKGVGEPPLILANSVGFAIVDAIYHARKGLGINDLFDYQFPLTPERIRRLVTQK
jgi:xanthine dehydrogenase/oxidase